MQIETFAREVRGAARSVSPFIGSQTTRTFANNSTKQFSATVVTSEMALLEDGLLLAPASRANRHFADELSLQVGPVWI
jgi:hypothetical protein